MEWATIFSDKPQTAPSGGWKMFKIHQKALFMASKICPNGYGS